eukprot:330456-Chlamydomonas_euryale.AAC.2
MPVERLQVVGRHHVHVLLARHACEEDDLLRVARPQQRLHRLDLLARLHMSEGPLLMSLFLVRFRGTGSLADHILIPRQCWLDVGNCNAHPCAGTPTAIQVLRYGPQQYKC